MTKPLVFLHRGDGIQENLRALHEAGYAVVLTHSGQSRVGNGEVRYFGVGSVLHAAFPDGRCARLVGRAVRTGYTEAWEVVPEIPATLWPEPAPVADRAEVRYGEWAREHPTAWKCSCPRIHSPEHIGCAMCFDRRPTPTP